ncbi:chromosome partitioning protein ParA, partial [Arthrospira sp. O9.13F]
SNEFGTVPGELIWISQNAIPPEEGRPFFSFRANIKLERQYFMLNEDVPGQEIQIKLQSGMAVNTKVNIGKRTVLQMLFSRLTGKFESITNLR